jgi:cytochrome P450
MSAAAAASLPALATREGPSDPGIFARDPLWRCPDTGIWLVESYELVREVLGRPEDFSSKTSLSMLDRKFPAGDVEAIHRDGGCVWARTLQTNDPPGHRRFRALVERVFAAPRVDALDASIRAAIAELLDRWAPGVCFEAVGQFAAPLPLRIIADELGVPRADAPRFKRWSDAAVQAIGLGATREQHLEAARAGVEFQCYFAALLADPARRPEHSLLARIADAAALPATALTLPEQLSLLHTLMIAGHETTGSALASLLRCLARDPALGEAARADPTAGRRLVEDVLRLHAPVQGVFRIVARDTRLGGVTLARGTLLCVRLGAANRDPARFADAAPLSATTSSAAHVSFGAGLHHCVGASLARRELNLALEAVLARFARLELFPDAAPLRYTQSVMTRSLLALPLIGVAHGA